MKPILFVSLILFFQMSVADDHSHDHHGHSKVKLTLNHGKKWATDKPLRENMSAIHDHIKARLTRIQKNTLTDAEYMDLSQKIKGNISAIFANCKLTPKADAQLHVVLAGMMASNKKIGGKHNPKEKASAVMTILENYQAYLKYFEHTEAKGK